MLEPPSTIMAGRHVAARERDPAASTPVTGATRSECAAPRGPRGREADGVARDGLATCRSPRRSARA
jgi:hypothetical protein